MPSKAISWFVVWVLVVCCALTGFWTFLYKNVTGTGSDKSTFERNYQHLNCQYEWRSILFEEAERSHFRPEFFNERPIFSRTGKGTRSSYLFSSGRILKEELIIEDIRNLSALEQFCPNANDMYFTSCQGRNYSDILLLKTNIDMQPIFTTSTKNVAHGIGTTAWTKLSAGPEVTLDMLENKSFILPARITDPALLRIPNRLSNERNATNATVAKCGIGNDPLVNNNSLRLPRATKATVIQDQLAKTIVNNLVPTNTGREGKIKGQVPSHLVAVRNALMNREGNVFNAQHFFFHGGCSDGSWHSPMFSYTFPATAVLSFTEPILNVAQPYQGNYFHEVIEGYQMLLLLKPVLRVLLNITIVMQNHLVHAKMAPLLAAYGIDMKTLNIHVLDEQYTLVYAPYIITTVAEECGFVRQDVANLMKQVVRSAFSEAWDATPVDLLPPAAPVVKLSPNGAAVSTTTTKTTTTTTSSSSSVGGVVEGVNTIVTPNSIQRGTIVLYDRFLDVYRKIDYGEDLYEQLILAYGPHTPHRRKVVRFFGNESFSDTLRMFSQCSLLIGAHGAGMTNMMFMHENTTVVELRSPQYPVYLLREFAKRFHLRHYEYLTGKGGYAAPTRIDVWQFLAWLKTTII